MYVSQHMIHNMLSFVRECCSCFFLFLIKKSKTSIRWHAFMCLGCSLLFIPHELRKRNYRKKSNLIHVDKLHNLESCKRSKLHNMHLKYVGIISYLEQYRKFNF